VEAGEAKVRTIAIKHECMIYFAASLDTKGLLRQPFEDSNSVADFGDFEGKVLVIHLIPPIPIGSRFYIGIFGLPALVSTCNTLASRSSDNEGNIPCLVLLQR
jgi:hypothetical protein